MVALETMAIQEVRDFVAQKEHLVNLEDLE